MPAARRRQARAARFTALAVVAALAITGCGPQEEPTPTQTPTALERDDVVSLMAPLTGYGNQNGQPINGGDQGQTAALGEALRAGDIHPYVEQYGTDD